MHVIKINKVHFISWVGVYGFSGGELVLIDRIPSIPSKLFKSRRKQFLPFREDEDEIVSPSWFYYELSCLVCPGKCSRSPAACPSWVVFTIVGVGRKPNSTQLPFLIVGLASVNFFFFRVELIYESGTFRRCTSARKINYVFSFFENSSYLLPFPYLV